MYMYTYNLYMYMYMYIPTHVHVHTLIHTPRLKPTNEMYIVIGADNIFV